MSQHCAGPYFVVVPIFYERDGKAIPVFSLGLFAAVQHRGRFCLDFFKCGYAPLIAGETRPHLLFILEVKVKISPTHYPPRCKMKLLLVMHPETA